MMCDNPQQKSRKYPGLYVIGLTGGIASGKSTVSKILKDLGAIIIDADQISREVTAPGSPGLRKVVQTFGESVLNADGSLNRKKLGEIVFHDKEALETLNSIVHPLVIRRTIDLLESESKKAVEVGAESIVVVDAALLFEVGAQSLVDQVWLVSLDEKAQVERLMRREGYSREEAICRIKAQMPLEDKIKLADVIIDNSGPVEETEEKVRNLFQKIRRKKEFQ